MADLNVAQIYADNPRTSFNATDLIYLSVSATTDGAIQAQNLFNTTNLQLSSGKINTIQNINTTATPQFAGIGIGTAANAEYTVLVDSVAGQAYYSQYWFGTVSKTGFDIFGLSYNASLTPDNNTHDATIFEIRPNFNLSNNAQDIYGLRFRPYLSNGTATNGYGVYIGDINNTGGGADIASYYGLYVEQPTVSSILNKCATFLGGVTIGSAYAAIAAPTNGLSVAGRGGFGLSSPLFPLHVVGTVAGGSSTVPWQITSSASEMVLNTGVTNSNIYIRPDGLGSNNGAMLCFRDALWIDNNAGVNYARFNHTTSGLSLGTTYVGIAPPANGLIVEGLSSFGTSAPNADARVNVSTGSAIGIFISGTQTSTNANPDQHGIFVLNAFSPTSGAAGVFGINCSPTVIAPSAQVISKFSAIETFPLLTSNVGTIAQIYGLNLGTGTGGAGTITSFTNLYVGMPTAAVNNKCAAFGGGISVGNSYLATLPPTNGLIVEGKTGIGVSSVDAEPFFQIEAASPYIFYLGGIQTQVDAFSDQYTIFISSQLSPTSGATDCSSMYIQPNVVAPSGQTIARAHGIHIYNVFSSNVGTVNVAYGLRIEGGSTASGTVSLAYGIHCSRPSHGTVAYTAYFEEGVGIGTSAPEASAVLDVQSTTKGLKIPSMTTTQKNAISSPVEGMIIFDSTLQKMCLRTSGAWETVTST